MKHHARYRNLQEFWPYYVREHSKASTRWLHFIGNTNLFIWLAAALTRRSLKLVLIAVISSYGIAWIGHFFFERNMPATFRYPILSALGDMRMYMMMWQGWMDIEVAKYAHANLD